MSDCNGSVDLIVPVDDCVEKQHLFKPTQHGRRDLYPHSPSWLTYFAFMHMYLKHIQKKWQRGYSLSSSFFFFSP